MLIDLKDVRPKNETHEHFMLKQVARAFLYKNDMRYIATEIEFRGNDISPFGQKVVVDVLGLAKKRKQNPQRFVIANKIQNKATEIASREGWSVANKLNNAKQTLPSYYHLKGEERERLKYKIEVCLQQACLELGYPRDMHTLTHTSFIEEWTIKTIEAKASLSDFRAGFNVSGDYSYIIAPKGIIPIKEVPKSIGLLEFDFNLFEEIRNWEKCLTVTKKAKKEYDGIFFEDTATKKGFMDDEHSKICKELMYAIAQENTEETVFWNPHIKNMENGYSISDWKQVRYKYAIAQETPLGIIVERRIGKNPDFVPNQPGFNGHTGRETEFYKLVLPNKEITKWITSKTIESSYS